MVASVTVDRVGSSHLDGSTMSPSDVVGSNVTVSSPVAGDSVMDVSSRFRRSQSRLTISAAESSTRSLSPTAFLLSCIRSVCFERVEAPLRKGAVRLRKNRLDLDGVSFVSVDVLSMGSLCST